MKNKTLLIIMILAVLAFFLFMKKNGKKGKENKADSKKQASASSSSDGETNSIESLYNPQYAITSTGKEFLITPAVGYVAGYNAEGKAASGNCSKLTIDGYSYKYKLTKEKMEEIIFYVESFIKDLCNTPNAFMVEYLRFFKSCNQEELDFAQDFLSLKGYVLQDRAGDSYIVESFEQVLTDPLQKKREGIEEWYALFK